MLVSPDEQRCHRICKVVYQLQRRISTQPTSTLEPNFLPDRPWQKLHADFKGPIAGSYYLHVVIDQYSKYPEVDVLTSTSFEKLRPALDRIFSTHGIPENLTTDNGPPYASHAMSEYAKHMGFELTPVTPDDPQSNGFAENFVKQICKLVHTAVADRKDPKEEVHNFLLQYRATPHSTTEYSPAELLFGRKIKTKLPQIAKRQETNRQKGMREQHDMKKLAQKKYFDKRYRTNEKPLKPGNKVLLKQDKSTTKPPYDPNPYKVVRVEGNRVTINNGEKERVRDKNKLKPIPARPAYLETRRQSAATRNAPRREADIHIDVNNQDSNQNIGATAEGDNAQHGGESPPQELSGDSAIATPLNAQPGGESSPNELSGESATSAPSSMAEHLQQLLSAAKERATEEVAEVTVNEDQGNQPAAAQQQEQQPGEPDDSQSAQARGSIEDREHPPSHTCSRGPHNPLQ